MGSTIGFGKPSCSGDSGYRKVKHSKGERAYPETQLTTPRDLDIGCYAETATTIEDIALNYLTPWRAGPKLEAATLPLLL